MSKYRTLQFDRDRDPSMRHARSEGRGRARRGGSVLILAMWVLFFLAALTVAVGSRVSGLLATAEYVGLHVRTTAAAHAGAMLSAQAIVMHTNAWDGVQADSWTRARAIFGERGLGPMRFEVGYRDTDDDGRSVTNTGVLGEEACVNLNQADTNLLAAYVALAGGVDASAARALAGAVADWRDADDEVLTGGAESAYYSQLSPSYRAANGRFRMVEELLLIKGVDDRLFGRLAPGLTVHGSGHVNLNAASLAVIESVGQAAGRTAEEQAAAGSLAKKIVAFRESGHAFAERDSDVLRKTLDEVSSLSSAEQALFAAMMGKVTIRSTCFRGTVSARRIGMDGVAGTVEFVFDRDARRFVQWREN